MEESVKRRRSCDVWDWPLHSNEGLVLVANDTDRFEADVEIPQFRPSEIDIKILDDQLVLHCAQDRPGGRAREIHRTYVLPPDVDLKSVKSTMRRDGVLQIVGSKKHH